MKTPSKSIAKSLQHQRVAGLSPSKPKVGRPKTGGVSMTVPGEGTVQRSPGPTNDATYLRSAARYADAIGTKVGGPRR